MAELPGFAALDTAVAAPPRLELAFGALGMGSPAGRFLGVSAITAGLLYLAKPSVFFDAQGHIRPWSVFTLGKASGGVEPTIVPFYVASMFVGLVAATFL